MSKSVIEKQEDLVRAEGLRDNLERLTLAIRGTLPRTPSFQRVDEKLFEALAWHDKAIKELADDLGR